MKVIINDNTHPGNNLFDCNFISRVQFIIVLLKLCTPFWEITVAKEG